jgi:hypothetical protein
VTHIDWAATSAKATPLVSSPRPSPSATTLQAPPADTFQTVGAIVAIAFALAAAIIGYRIIRGGRGL